LHDWKVDAESGKTLISLYMESTRRLGAEEMTVLEKMKDAFLSLYEVQEVFPEKGLLLKDILLGGDYEVKEKRATRGLRRWDILAARLLCLDGDYILSGSVYPYPLRAKEEIVAHIKDCFKDYRKDHPTTTLRDFLKSDGDLFNYHWREMFREPFSPVLVTASGEPLMFCTAAFEIKDKEGAAKGLKTLDNVEEVEDGVLDWLDEPESDGSATVLGTISLKGNTLKLTCKSKERLERGKAIILDKLGGTVAHRADMFQEPSQAMKSLSETPPKAETEIPPEEQQEFYTQYMQQHYERWLDEKLPILKGKTPLEAVKQRSGKKKVAEILKTIENGEEHKKLHGEAYFDTSWLWERLGLDK
jgi:hypothetical protein